MSSHREAPEISKDPVADNTDTYAFVSPDQPDAVTILTNYVPLEDPPGGPNFFEFGDDVLYHIYIDNDGDGRPEIEYRFRFETELRNPDTFLYNTGQITSLNSTSWNRRQFYDVTRVDHKHRNGRAHHASKSKVIGHELASPPCNVGPRSTPNYPELAEAAVHKLDSGETVFAGQRNEGFFVDLGSIFDLGDLRPLQNLHLIATSPAMGVDATATLNVHTIAIRVPIKDLTRDGSVDECHGGARRLGSGQPPQDAGDRPGQGRACPRRALGAGLSVGQPSIQRGDRPARRQGQVERRGSGRR